MRKRDGRNNKINTKNTIDFYKTFIYNGLGGLTGLNKMFNVLNLSEGDDQMEIGHKIKNLRIKNALTQEELANRCELTKGFISQLERDLTSPSIATLVDILEGLGTNLQDFFSETRDEKIVFAKEDVFIKENEDVKSTISWIIPNAQKNAMEPILMEIKPSGKTKEIQPHEGEEFGYVIQGAIDLHMGNLKHRVKKGESFYYKPGVTHYLSNSSNSKAVVLWVSTPPIF